MLWFLFAALAVPTAGLLAWALQRRLGRIAAAAVAASLLGLAGFGLHAWQDMQAERVAARAPATPASAEQEAPQTGESQTGVPDVTTMLARLEDRLAEQPDDLQGWITLGQTRLALEQHAAAVAAFDRALALDGGLAYLHSARGEALVLAAGEKITEEARAAFAAALERDAEEPRARFYLALAAEQDGAPRRALEMLLALLKSAPPEAAWSAVVRSRTEALARDLGEDPAAVLPAVAATPERGPTADDIEAAQGLSDGSRQEMIRGMVAGLAERLAEQPDDLEGWRMLARSYDTLGQPAEAAAAHRRVTELAPTDTAARLAYAEALVAAAGPKAMPPEAALAALQQVLDLEPDNPEALYQLGEAARRRGDATSAGLYWERLLRQLPPGTREHDWLHGRIESLPKGPAAP